MRYKTIKHMKTKSKVIAISDTLTAAIAAIPSPASFVELSYVGQFPIYNSIKGVYSIQGQHEYMGIVCSIPKEELATLTK